MDQLIVVSTLNACSLTGFSGSVIAPHSIGRILELVSWNRFDQSVSAGNLQIFKRGQITTFWIFLVYEFCVIQTVIQTTVNPKTVIQTVIQTNWICLLESI
jgi:hypothetical protein